MSLEPFPRDPAPDIPEPGIGLSGERPADSVTTRADSSDVLSWIPRLGVWAWSFVGVVAATVIVVAALAAVNEIVLPLTFAAVLAVVFRPLVGVLQRRRFKPSVAAGAVVLGLLALVMCVTVATVQGVLEQVDQIGPRSTRQLTRLPPRWHWTRPRWSPYGRQPRNSPRRSRAAF